MVKDFKAALAPRAETPEKHADRNLSGRLEAIQAHKVVCDEGVQDAPELGRAILTGQRSAGSRRVQ